MDKASGYRTGHPLQDPYKKIGMASAILAIAVLAAYVLQQMGVIPNSFL
jgi:hypothetical protein